MRLFFMLALFLPLAISSASEGSLQELSRQVAMSRGETKICKRFRKKWTGVVKGGLSSESASHTSREHALEVLKVFESFPEIGQASRRATNYLAENRESLLAYPDQNEVLEQVGSIQPECGFFSRATHLNLLVKDVKAFSFSKKDRQRLERVLKRYLVSGSAALLSVKQRGIVLQTYIENIYEGKDRDALLEKAKALQANLELGREKLETEAKSPEGKGKQGTFAFFGRQLELGQRLAGAQVELAKEAGL